MVRFLKILIACGSLVFMSDHTEAKEELLYFCDAHKTVEDLLNKKYGEIMLWQGQRDEAILVELFVSPTSGTWTLILTKTNKSSCQVASGEGWDFVFPRSEVQEAIPEVKH